MMLSVKHTVAKVLYNFHKMATNNKFDHLLLLKILSKKLRIFGHHHVYIEFQFTIQKRTQEKKTNCLLIYHILLHSVIQR